MTPTYLVATRTGRYQHAAWLPHGGVRTDHWGRVVRVSVICNRVPNWHDFFLAKNERRPLCPTCARMLHRMADHDLVAPVVGVAV